MNTGGSSTGGAASRHVSMSRLLRLSHRQRARLRRALSTPVRPATPPPAGAYGDEPTSATTGEPRTTGALPLPIGSLAYIARIWRALESGPPTAGGGKSNTAVRWLAFAFVALLVLVATGMPVPVSCTTTFVGSEPIRSGTRVGLVCSLSFPELAVMLTGD